MRALRGVTLALLSSSSFRCHGDRDGTRPPPTAATPLRIENAPAPVPAPSGPTERLPYRFVGRGVPEPGGGIRFAWSGSSVETRFEGPALDVELDDPGENAFEIVLDGKVLAPLRTESGDRTYRIVTGAGPGAHGVVVSRRTEAMAGETAFRGFRTVGGVLLGVERGPRRAIELVGDSITAGLGNEGTDPCPRVAESQNAYETYGEIAARALSADVVNVSWSGVRASGPPPTMTDLYVRALPRRADTIFPFSLPHPDAVVVNLGDNDDVFSPGGAARFEADYVRFVRSLRARYPDALILCATGPMAVGSSAEARSAIRSAVRTLADAKIFYLEFSPVDEKTEGLGCGSHPTVKTHRRMAETLRAALAARLGW